MRRRDFIQGIAVSSAWPLVARAQQGEQMRRIGLLMNIGADDPEAPVLVGAFSQGLAESGWIIAAMRGSIIDGIKATRKPLARTRRNCSRRRRISSTPLAPKGR